jgi:hypothetical protein
MNKATSWKVYKFGKFIGIIETNFVWASQYWESRSGCKLRPVN